MEEQTLNPRGLVWKEEYSVGVVEIDNQHKQLIDLINKLMDIISTHPDEEVINALIGEIVQYKRAHFATEEKYFHEFNYEGTKDHEAAHRLFDTRVTALQELHKDDIATFAFELVDFLEDWFIKHLMGTDKKYMKCFAEHGLH